MKATSTAIAPFPWFGGKQRMAPRIIDLFPEHTTYVEVFGGAGAVILSKSPAVLDVYNDRYDGLVNFFRVLRDRPDELVPLLELTPYSRSEWETARATWRHTEDDVERARLFYVVASQSYGGFVASDGPRDRCKAGRGWGGEKLGRVHASRPASNANRVDHIWRFVERLRTVQVDNLDWRACLDRYDHADCLFYLDPPYVPATRRAGGYAHELTAEEHTELVDRVLELEGCAIVSGYDHPIYAPLVDVGGFAKYEFTVWSTAGQRQAGRSRDKRREIVWASPRAAAANLFNHESVA